MNRATAASGAVSAMKDCPVPGCRSRIARWWLVQPVCRLHWALVPGWIKREVLRTAPHGARDPEYRRAVETAVESLISSKPSVDRQSKGAKAA